MEVRSVLASYQRNGLLSKMSKELDMSTVGNGDHLTGLAIPGLQALHDFHNVFFFLFNLPRDHMLATKSLTADKNWEPSVFGPTFAMDKMPPAVRFRMNSSSSNFSP